MKPLLRERARNLRIEGYSYAMIKEQLGVSKGTLSNWLAKIPFQPNESLLQRVSAAKLRSGLNKHREKLENISAMRAAARVDVGKLSARDIFMFGIGLYLGEGSKSTEEIRVINSDPTVLKLAMRWLKSFARVKTNHLRVAIHCYPDNDIEKLIAFWSKQLNIPPIQFIKTQIDRRKNKSRFKHGKLPYGTAHLYVRGGGTLPLGVKSLHRKIIGWIEAATEQI